MGTRSLGDYLFRNKTLKRSPFEVTQLLPSMRLYDLSTEHFFMKPKILWGRRSLFYLKLCQQEQASERALLVSEVFMPWVFKL